MRSFFIVLLFCYSNGAFSVDNLYELAARVVIRDRSYLNKNIVVPEEVREKLHKEQERLREEFVKQSALVKDILSRNIKKSLRSLILEISGDMSCLQLSVPLRYSSISTNLLQDGFLKVGHDDSYNLCLVNGSRRDQLKKFIYEEMPFMQILLLRFIEMAKEQKRYLKLTHKEQKVFDELLPEIKKAVSFYVIFHNLSPFTVKFWISSGRNVFLKRESQLRDT